MPDHKGPFAVIFSAQRAPDTDDYDQMAELMSARTRQMPGFISMDHARSADGFGITVCYWESEEAIANWKKQMDHQEAQRLGKEKWYTDYNVRIAKVVREYAKK